MNKQEELNQILQTMEIPRLRFSDMGWLMRNIGVKNSNHPKIDEAIRLIKEIHRDQIKGI